ncbi:hypothetical protein B0O99DRAFT_590187 [Bisporella sp. PMI_857]|nr:hypothetical protein B0O99DRAFT_590187 [Bisporella sp. PMI_857]
MSPFIRTDRAGTPKSDGLPKGSQKTARPTPTPNLPHIASSIDPRDEPDYLTLPLSSISGTQTTVVLLGSTLPTSTTPPLSYQTVAPQKVYIPGVSAQNLAGIIAGCVAGFFLLMGVLYVYLLRARQRAWKRKQRRKKKRKKGRSRSGRSSKAVNVPQIRI